jgi:hypothetical protein
MNDQSPAAQITTFAKSANNKRGALVIFALASLLSACVQEQPETGVVLPGPDAESWGMADSAILFSDSILNDNGTTTVVLQIDSAAVSDDELAAAPALICEDGRPNILSSDVRSPTAAGGLGDNVLIMTVTCGP